MNLTSKEVVTQFTVQTSKTLRPMPTESSRWPAQSAARRMPTPARDTGHPASLPDMPPQHRARNTGHPAFLPVMHPRQSRPASASRLALGVPTVRRTHCGVTRPTDGRGGVSVASCDSRVPVASVGCSLISCVVALLRPTTLIRLPAADALIALRRWACTCGAWRLRCGECSTAIRPRPEAKWN